MVRRGSTVRVRQRALGKALETAPFLRSRSEQQAVDEANVNSRGVESIRSRRKRPLLIPALVREPLERTEVVVRGPGPAVQADERRPSSLAGDSVPRPAERPLEEALHGTSLRKCLGTLCRLPS